MAVVGFVSATVVSLGICALVYVFGDRLGVLDLPDDDLKTHRRPVVPLGGAGVLVGLHVGLLIADAFDTGLLAATVIVWVMGVVDDVRGLSPVVRLVGATVAGVALVATADLLGIPILYVFWVVATVVLVNAVNLFDGMDGLVGVISIVALGGLWWFGVAQDAAGPSVYLVAIGAILGFLYWNLPPAKMFLGDNGAYVVGVALTWAAMEASPDRSAALVGVAIIGVPLLDLAITVARRFLAGRPLFVGDRDHTYDRMHAAGWSVGRVLLVLAVAQVVWVTAVVVVAVAFGDLIAAGTALVVAVVTVGVTFLGRGTESAV